MLAVIRNRSRGVLTPEDHEEIASDVFLALWRGAKNITRGQLRPWLGAVARKQTAEAMRKKNVYLPLEDDALITLDRLWEQMVEKERCEALAQALAALPEEDREIFYRFYDLSQTTALIEGHIASYDETTDVDITQPTYTEEEQAMIDEYIVDYEEYPAIGSGGMTLLNGTYYINSFSLREYDECIKRGDMSIMGATTFNKRDLMRYRFMMQLFGLRLDKRQ